MTRKYFFTERRAKNDNEGFSWWESCLSHLSGLTSVSSIYKMPLLVMWFVDVIGLSQSAIDGNRQMIYPITCPVFFQSACPFLTVSNGASQMVVCKETIRYSQITNWRHSYALSKATRPDHINFLVLLCRITVCQYLHTFTTTHTVDHRLHWEMPEVKYCKTN